jgi:hypothetical protein
MSRRTFLAVFVLFASLAGVAQQKLPNLRLKARSVPELQADQRTLISQWCRFDYEGSRLTDDGWKKLEPVTSIKRNPDFNSIYVISRYQVNPPTRVSMEGTATYTVIGRYELGIGYTPVTDSRYVEFKFAEKDGDLQLVDVDPVQPNVSKPAFIAWLKTQLASTKNATDKLPLQQALDQMVPPPPKPKVDQGSSSSKQVY